MNPANGAEAPDGPGESYHDRLGAELVRLSRLQERAYARFAVQSEDGVERAAFLLLVHLVRTGPQRLSTLAEAVHSDVSTVSRQVAQLVRSGLVVRRPDPSDGRAGLLAVTERGVVSYEARRRRRNRDMAGVLAGWTDVQRREFAALLTRFNIDYERFHLRGPAR